MKKIVFVLIATMSTAAFAENNGLTGGGSGYDNYSGGYEPAPSPRPVPVPSKNYLKTCVSYDGVTYKITENSVDVQGQSIARLALQPNGSLVSTDAKYKVFLSSNVLLLNNSVVVNCR